MLQQRRLTERVGGTYGGPRGRIGQYLDNGLPLVSGVTYGGQGDSLNYSLLPSLVSGETRYDPIASNTGSSLSAVQQMSTFQPQYYDSDIQIAAGLDGAPTGSSYGGTNFGM